VRKTTVEERRTEILETTCQVVIERGFAATRVADVATRLGVSTGLIHYHFESKDHLLAEAFQFAASADLNRVSVEIGSADSPLAKLDRLFSLYSGGEAEAGWMLWIDGWGEALRSTAVKKISQDLDLRWKAALESVIRQGLADGSFRCSDPDGAAWRLAALLDGLGVQVTVHEGLISSDQLFEWVRAAACAELDLPVDAFSKLARPGAGS